MNTTTHTTQVKPYDRLYVGGAKVMRHMASCTCGWYSDAPTSRRAHTMAIRHQDRAR